MGQSVYVLMMLEGGGKNKEWRPVGVVTDLSIAEQWQQSGRLGKDVDCVPLELDDISQIYPDKGPRFQPRPLNPMGERIQETVKELTEANEELRQVNDQLRKRLKLQPPKPAKASLLKQAEVPPKPAGFEDVLHDAQEIADYIETYALYPVDNEFVYEKFRGSHAVLKLVPLAELQEGGRDANQQSKKNEDKYLKQNLKTQPPAVVENGKVLDGNHRFRANQRRGLTAMWCYVVMEGDYASNDDASGDQES
jgi:hypothetical protein